MKHKVRIATRASQLALYQANWVGQALAAKTPGLEYELVEVGNLPLQHKDSFVKLCEEVLLQDKADIAVHSAKDLPLGERPGLSIAAYCERANPLDALLLSPAAARAVGEATPTTTPTTTPIAPPTTTPATGMKIGTASPRRRVQLMNYAIAEQTIAVAELRGNVPTRLAALKGINQQQISGAGDNEEGKTLASNQAQDFDAIVLAVAGLQRLGLDGYISHYFTPQEMVPAAGQGAILVQLSADKPELAKQTKALNHPATELCVMAERHCCHLLGADCDSAVGAYAFISDGQMNLYAMVGDMESNQMLKTHQSISISQDGQQAALACGQQAADDLNHQGAKDFIYQQAS